jgi:hypothetical protein
MLGRAAGIRETASLPNKLRIQEALFPHGLTVTKEEIGTSSMPLFFRYLHEVPIGETSLASTIIASWNPLLEWLKRVEISWHCSVVPDEFLSRHPP